MPSSLENVSQLPTPPAPLPKWPVSLLQSMTQAPFTFFCLCACPQSKWAYMWTFQEQSLSFRSSPGLPTGNPTGLQSQTSRGLIFLVQVPRGSPGGTWTPNSMGGTSAVVISLPLVGPTLWVWVLSRLHLWPSCPPLHSILFTSKLQKICCARLQVIPRDNHSTCSLGVSTGGAELRIFLFCLLDLEPLSICSIEEKRGTLWVLFLLKY